MVFVTGATGLVGVRLVYDLFLRGYSVKALRRSSSSMPRMSQMLRFYTNNPQQIIDAIEWVEGDITDYDVLSEHISEGMDVYHCAAMVSFNPALNRQLYEVNVEGTANMVNICLQNKVHKFCYVSSIGALGSPLNGEEINTETPWNAAGKSAYSLSKHLGEIEVWRGIAEGLNVVIVNPAVILGIGDGKTGSAELFDRINKGMKFYTHGSTGYVYVNDVTRAMIALMESDIQNQQFLLSAQNMSYKSLFDQIAGSLGVKAPKYAASAFLTALVWRLEKVRTFLMGGEPRLTKHTHKIAHSSSAYNGEPIKSSIQFEYSPINEAIINIGQCYKLR